MAAAESAEVVEIENATVGALEFVVVLDLDQADAVTAEDLVPAVRTSAAVLAGVTGAMVLQLVKILVAAKRCHVDRWDEAATTEFGQIYASDVSLADGLLARVAIDGVAAGFVAERTREEESADVLTGERVGLGMVGVFETAAAAGRAARILVLPQKDCCKSGILHQNFQH